jgi:hypothetical protein
MHGVFPVFTSAKASRKFSQWLTPKSTEFTPPYKLLEASVEVIQPLKTRTAAKGLFTYPSATNSQISFLPVITKDPFRGQ